MKTGCSPTKVPLGYLHKTLNLLVLFDLSPMLYYIGSFVCRCVCVMRISPIEQNTIGISYIS